MMQEQLKISNETYVERNLLGLKKGCNPFGWIKLIDEIIKL